MLGRNVAVFREAGSRGAEPCIFGRRPSKPAQSRTRIPAEASPQPRFGLITEQKPGPGHKHGGSNEASSTREVHAKASEGNPVANFWAGYQRRVETEPVPTKALTSFLGFVFGDILAQDIEGHAFSIFRCMRLGTYGLVFDGPAGHWWYSVLDRVVEPQDPRGTKAVLLKTAADQLIWAPVMTCVFFAVLKSLEGHPEFILPTIQAKLVKTVAANYVIWPAAHFINFRFVPTEHRILYNNVVSVAWTAWLSMVSHDPCPPSFNTLAELWHYLVCLAREWRFS